MRKERSTAAIVLAAGQGKRFRSSISKLAHPLAGRPLILWTLSALREAGVPRIVVVVGHAADSLRKLCGPDVEFAVQNEPKGTGHATLAAAPLFENFTGDILIVNGDVPLLRAETLRGLLETHRHTGGMLTVGTSALPDPHGWGRIIRQRGTIVSVVEERDATTEQRAFQEVNVGLYCANASLLFPMLERITPDNAQKEIYLTDLIGRAAAAGIYVADVQVDPAEVSQVNSRADLAGMEAALRRQINARWLDAGVTMLDPATTYIEPDVRIGRDTVLGPNVQLRGKTVLGERCRLDGTALLCDAVVADDVLVRLGVTMTECHVGHRCQIGPFANLRPGTRLANDVHIGDFVETKNAVVGRGTKANHLAYLGDTEIGEDTNVGAGTITCNYDGFAKHRTIVGSRVQIGSDSQLVAPITVADDVYIATGTTVRRNVEPGCLVYCEKNEVHRPGWVAKKRARSGATSTAAAPESRAPRSNRTRASEGPPGSRGTRRKAPSTQPIKSMKSTRSTKKPRRKRKP